jgi:hypothetical protein
MNWIGRMLGANHGMPRANWTAATVGVALGVSIVLGPALMMGAHHVRLAWVVALAMLWSPAFCFVPDDPAAREAQRVARFLGAFSITALMNVAALSAVYLGGWLFLSS